MYCISMLITLVEKKEKLHVTFKCFYLMKFSEV